MKMKLAVILAMAAPCGLQAQTSSSSGTYLCRYDLLRNSRTGRLDHVVIQNLGDRVPTDRLNYIGEISIGKKSTGVWKLARPTTSDSAKMRFVACNLALSDERIPVTKGEVDTTYQTRPETVFVHDTVTIREVATHYILRVDTLNRIETVIEQEKEEKESFCSAHTAWCVVGGAVAAGGIVCLATKCWQQEHQHQHQEQHQHIDVKGFDRSPFRHPNLDFSVDRTPRGKQVRLGVSFALRP